MGLQDTRQNLLRLAVAGDKIALVSRAGIIVRQAWIVARQYVARIAQGNDHVEPLAPFCRLHDLFEVKDVKGTPGTGLARHMDHRTRGKLRAGDVEPCQRPSQHTVKERTTGAMLPGNQ